MQGKTNKPIFVVGSRVHERASSLRVWVAIRICFPCQSQIGWGDFAVNVAIAYQIGAARGDHSILSAMDIGDSELFAAFGQSIDDLILRHCTDVETKRETVAPNGIYASRSGSDVDCNVSPVEH